VSLPMFEVLEPGPLTTVQDTGRYGLQRYGIPVSGALDLFSLRAANMLVGNAETAAGLECTFLGPRLRALQHGLIAVTGAEVPALVNGKLQPTWQSLFVQPGAEIAFRPPKRGVRVYIAVAGGVLVPEVMGSRSTFLGGRLGGFHGRPLERGDTIFSGIAALGLPVRTVPDELRPDLTSRVQLRAVPGPQDDFFDRGMEVFYGSEFRVSVQADRIGYRLTGPEIPFRRDVPSSIISEPSLRGVVQVPPDGRPIIIFGEQTVGGYAKIATVISPDLDRVAQARPGDTVTFRRCTLGEAHEAHRAYRARLDRIRGL
jgi:antagonist of KipI